MNRHNSPEWRRFSRMRADRQRKARKRFQRHTKERNRAKDSSALSRGTGRGPKPVRRTEIVGPKSFSIITNYSESNAFLNRVRQLLYANKKIFVDLEETRQITLEAVLVLLEIIKDVGGKKSSKRISAAIGKGPLSNTAAGTTLVESGFFDHVASDLPAHLLQHGKGKMLPRKGTRVNNDTADAFCQRAAKAIFVDRETLPAVYRTFIELMGNTRQHANPKEETTELWWAMANVDAAVKRAKFAFYDAGVGIIGSFQTRLRKKLAALGLSPSDPEILEHLLTSTGKSQSRTKIPYRGKGLPAIAKALERNQIENLRIVTNRVVADVSANTYQYLNEEFVGALITWEVGKSNDNYSNLA